MKQKDVSTMPMESINDLETAGAKIRFTKC